MKFNSSIIKKEKENFIKEILQGKNPFKLSKRYTQAIDEFISSLFSDFSKDAVILARGSYGRREMTPQSDVDFLIIFRGEGQPFEDVLYPLWDAGIKIGYAVLSIEEAVEKVTEDITSITSVFDGRYVAGNKNLHQLFLKEFLMKFTGSSFPYFFELIENARRERREKYGIYAELLEPNLKNSCGGLRDVHECIWVSMAMTEILSPLSILKTKILSISDFKMLRRAYSFVFFLRCLLHSLSSRGDDLLTMSAQVEIARVLYPHFDRMKGVKKLMKNYHLHAHIIEGITSKFFSRIRMDFVGLKERRIPDEKNLSLHRVLMWVRDVQIQGAIFPKFSGKIELKKFPLYPLKERERKNLLDIFSERGRVGKTVEFMFNSGILFFLAPEFKRIINLYQYDVYHAYTVDVHTILTLKEVDEILMGNQDLLIPAIVHARANLENNDLHALYLSALFHDSGKGFEGKGHHERSAKIARKTLQRWGFDKSLIEYVSFLVENHLKMAEFSQKRDIHDLWTLKSFLQLIGNEKRLKTLLLLTVADMRGSGPGVYSEWKGMLLDELYYRTYELFSLGEFSTALIEEQTKKLKKEILEEVEPHERELFLKFLNGFNENYLLENYREKILEHFEFFKKYKETGLLIHGKIFRDKFGEITVLCRDSLGILSKITGSLTLSGLDIKGARIKTHSDGFILDQFYVHSLTLERTDLEEGMEKFKNIFQKVLKSEINLKESVMSKLPSYHSVYPVYRDVSVFVDNELSPHFSIVEVRAPDFPGLLYLLTSTLSENNLNIHVAKISTEVDLAVDAFYVTDFKGEKISEKRSSEICEILKMRVEEAVKKIIK